MRKFCGCKTTNVYDKIRNFILKKFLTFFSRMENKLWRELYVLKVCKKCDCKYKRSTIDFAKKIKSQSPNPSMFE